MSSVEQAKALLSRGVSRPTLYSVRMPTDIGVGLGSGSNGIGRDTRDYIDLYARAVTIPEVRLNHDIALGQENMGIARETARNIVYGKPLTITIIENSDFTVYRNLRTWFDMTGRNANQDGLRSLRMNYYDSYCADLDIFKYEQPNEPNIRRGVNRGTLSAEGYKMPIMWQFINAHPINIGQVSMASDAFDTALQFDVQFTYESFSVKYDDITPESIRNRFEGIDESGRRKSRRNIFNEPTGFGGIYPNR